MLFLAEMGVRIPHDLPPDVVEDLKQREKETALKFQRVGRWPHLWRVVGRYANVSVLDVDSNDELPDLLSSLPLFPYLGITVSPLATHPSAVPPASSEAPR